MRLRIIVEGQTEEAFVKAVLKPHLDARGVYTSVTTVGKVKAHHSGSTSWGGGPFTSWRKDITHTLRGDRNDDLRVSTLFDLYGLPRDFPGLDEHGSDTDTVRRCESLERALADEFDDHRFIPYIQRHEFEALVLAALPSLRELLDAEDDLDGLAALETEVSGADPEDINDGTTTAPSKRLLAHIPGYSKTLHGPLATDDTGLAALRARCRRFDAWVRKLEAL